MARVNGSITGATRGNTDPPVQPTLVEYPPFYFLHRVPSVTISATFAGTGSLTSSILVYKLLTPTLAGKGSLTASIAGVTRNLAPTLSGHGTLTAHFAGLTKHIAVGLAGHGSLTLTYDIGPPGGRLSQVAVEVLMQSNTAQVRLSQITVEVLRSRSGLHVWQTS